MLEYINKAIYKHNKLIVISIEEEKQKAEYASSRLKLLKGLSIKTIRFRVAKRTPCKEGQFVTF